MSNKHPQHHQNRPLPPPPHPSLTLPYDKIIEYPLGLVNSQRDLYRWIAEKEDRMFHAEYLTEVVHLSWDMVKMKSFSKLPLYVKALDLFIKGLNEIVTDTTALFDIADKLQDKMNFYDATRLYEWMQRVYVRNEGNEQLSSHYLYFILDMCLTILEKFVDIAIERAYNDEEFERIWKGE